MRNKVNVDYKRICTILSLSILISCAGSGNLERPENETKVLISRIIDGDSIRFRQPMKFRERYFSSLRYIGIDTPEYGKPYWRAAKALNKSLVYGKRVRLEFDRDMVDRYGRLLAYVHVDGIFVNAELVRRGYAKVMTIEPNTRYANLFRQLETEAKGKQLGIWQRSYTYDK